jgi:methyl-accepting chemotaxis protein
MVRQTLNQLGEASGQMRTTSAGLSTVSRQTNSRVQEAEKASGEASMSVETVAAASEQLSASINDISQQAALRPASPAARSTRRVIPTAPSRGSPNRRGGSAKSSASSTPSPRRPTSWR